MTPRRIMVGSHAIFTLCDLCVMVARELYGFSCGHLSQASTATMLTRPLEPSMVSTCTRLRATQATVVTDKLIVQLHRAGIVIVSFAYG